jgi:hypothetical protein
VTEHFVLGEAEQYERGERNKTSKEEGGCSTWTETQKTNMEERGGRESHDLI